MEMAECLEIKFQQERNILCASISHLTQKM